MAYETPDAAATADLPPNAVKVLDVAISPDAQHAVVLLAVGEPPSEVMESLCHRQGDGWEERETEEGAGWSWIPDFEQGGVHTTWTVETAMTDGFEAVKWNAPPPRPPASGLGSATW
jgi:hypothetical protein